MNIEAVITGDIVDSTKLSFDDRDSMIDALKQLPAILKPLEDLKMEMFRGDSFQLRVKDARLSLKIALCIRAYLRSHKMQQCGELLDARVAIGIGTIDYQSDTLSTSDGEAFRLSGRLLDNIGKKRIEIQTPWPSVNEELMVSTAFADDIVSGWTQSQSRIEFYNFILSRKRIEIARRLGISRQMVDKSLKSSKETLINAYVGRFEQILANRLNCEV